MVPEVLVLDAEKLNGNQAINVEDSYNFDSHTENLKINKVLNFGKQKSVQDMIEREIRSKNCIDNEDDKDKKMRTRVQKNATNSNLSSIEFDIKETILKNILGDFTP